MVAPKESRAFPVETGARANQLVGWADFSRGFVDPAVDMFFGADPTAANRFFVPADVAYDVENERVFVADIHNHRFLVFDAADGFATEQGAQYVLGQPDFLTGGADSSDPFGNVNSPNPAYGCAAGVNACGVHRAWAVEYDSGNQRLFGADPDNNRILIWDLSAGLADGMPASWVIGQASFTSREPNVACDGSTGTGVNACGLSRPTDMLVDTAGQRLFVADSGNNRVVVFDLTLLESGMPQAVAVLGQQSLGARAPGTGCGGIGRGVTDACSLSLPLSLAYDDVGQRLFVSDYDAHRVVVYDLSAGVVDGMAAAAVLGQPDLSTATPNTACGGGSSGEENTNACGLGVYGALLAYDGQNDQLFAADVANHRVLAFDTSSLASGAAAVAVIGQQDFSSGYVAAAADWGGGTDRGLLNMPQGIAYDPLGDRLLVTDGGNHRLLTFGANIGGDPVVVDGHVDSSTTTQESDGSTTVDVVGEDGDGYSVSFPPGTEPLDGEEEIVVTIDETHNNRPVVRVSAELPPGETKTITMPSGNTGYLCVYDHAEAEIDAFNCNGGLSGNPVTLPWFGCKTVTVDGDLGDNPDDPSDPRGRHEIELCPVDGGRSVRISGLRHTILVGNVDVPVDVGDPAAPLEPAPDDEAPAELSGCSSSGAASWLAALLVLLALGAQRAHAGLRAPARRRGRRARR